MEDGQRARISKTYRHVDLPQIHVLHIEDEYEYLNPELINILTERIESTLKVEWGIK